jgi:hypothetical protein
VWETSALFVFLEALPVCFFLRVLRPTPAASTRQHPGTYLDTDQDRGFSMDVIASRIAVEKELGLCWDFAQMARATRSYVVHSAQPSLGDLGPTTRSFDEAFSLLLENPESWLKVMVEWKFGSKSGLEVVNYSSAWVETDTITFVEQRIDFLVGRAIALSMYREHQLEAAQGKPKQVRRERYDARATTKRLGPII